LNYAWEVTVDDVFYAINANDIKISWENANKIHDMLDHDEVVAAALYGEDMDDQAAYASDEIRNQVFDESGNLRTEFAFAGG
jgi:hypothetical protein